MIDLKNTTFIIPISLESEDRKFNANLTLRYLCENLNTNIIIFEYDTEPKLYKILNNLSFKCCSIYHKFIENVSGNNIFHRTKLLNEMLNIVETPVVVNYDIDIILDIDTYQKCSNLITNGMDLVYPYFFGDSQRQINYSGRQKLLDSLSLQSLSSKDYTLAKSEYGHCQFFNTKSYKQGGMENEQFISYAPRGSRKRISV